MRKQLEDLPYVQVSFQGYHDASIKETRIPVEIKNALPYLGIMNIVLFILLMLEASFEEKKRSIRKLLGDTNLHIIAQAFRKDALRYAMATAASLGVSFLYVYFDWNVSYFLRMLLGMVCLQYIVWILYYGILYILQRRLPILSAIARGTQHHALLRLNDVVKLLVIVMASHVLAQAYGDLCLLIGEYQTADNLKEKARDLVQLDGMDAEINLLIKKRSQPCFIKHRRRLKKAMHYMWMQVVLPMMLSKILLKRCIMMRQHCFPMRCVSMIVFYNTLPS